MANGFSLGVLQMMKEITKDATPAYKIEPYGFLASLYVAHSRGIIKNDSYDGHYKTVKVKKKQRFTIQDTDTVASCDTTLLQPYSEDTVSVANYRQLAFSISDETIAQFDSYASAIVKVNGVPAPTQAPGGLMFEFMDTLMTAANALLTAVNKDLGQIALNNMGVNRNTGSAAATTVNIPLNATNNPLAGGTNKILTDFKDNTMNGKPIVVGAGLFNGFMMNQAAIGGVNQAGVDSRRQAAGFDFWYDFTLASMAGANTIALFEKDAIQIVEYLKYQGFKAGPKPGPSTFGTIALPMQVGDQLVPVYFDYQLRYNDCPTELTIYDTGTPTVIQKGYNLILSKNFGLYTIGTDAYRTGDPLNGNRGSLLYTITNT